MTKLILLIAGYITGLAIAVAFIFITAPDSAKLTRILENQSYTNVVIHGYSFFGCRDTYSYSFTATRLDTGRTVNGYICGGMLSGYVTRLED